MSRDERDEVERKYAVGAAVELPLRARDGGPHVKRELKVTLKAVYFDTDSRDLFTRGITLRRRTGGDDAGWQLKVPRGTDRRTETHHPPGRAVTTVPSKVAEPVRAVVRDRPLRAVAAITTRRREYTLVDDDDQVLATVCDDHVTARTLPEQDEQVWREWEVELADGQPRSVLADLEGRLLAAGARRAVEASKLGRLLGSTAGGDGTGTIPSATPRSAGTVLQERLAAQIAALHEQDAAMRAGASDGVHGMRIAARRLRSALTTTKQLLAVPSTEEAREELRWLGQELSPARDTEVLAQRLAVALDAEPAELVMGPARARLDAELHRDHAEGLARAQKALDSTRYYRLLDALDNLVADPPMTARGHKADRTVLADLVRRDARRLRRAVRAATGADTDTHDAALHEARKKAKRLRYAAELAQPVGGKGAKRLAKRAKAVQQALGEHQDTVVARERLRQLGAQAFLHGENGFAFGLLHALERGHAAEAEQRFRAAWDRMPSPKAAARWIRG